MSVYGIVEGVLEINGRRIDLSATWENVRNQPTNWWNHLGLGVHEGELMEIWQTASEMGSPAGKPKFKAIDLDCVVFVE